MNTMLLWTSVLQLQLLPNVSWSQVIDLQCECATMRTCDFLDDKPGEGTPGLKES